MKYNVSSKFLLPLVSSSTVRPYSAAFKNSFMGAEGYDCDYGKCLFLLYDEDSVSDTLDSSLKSVTSFKETYKPSEGEKMYVFELNEWQQEKVIAPFLEGKYSQIDREYVTKNFPRNPGSKTYRNRLVLDKDPAMKLHWEKSLGVKLPEGAELYDKPLKENEVYVTKSDAIEVPD